MRASVEDRIIQGLEEFAEALENRLPIAEQFTYRRVVLELKPKSYAPAMVKKTRKLLSASQAVFAVFLGVSVKTVQAWEQGAHPPNRMACRFMDEIRKNPKLYYERLKEVAVVK